MSPAYYNDSDPFVCAWLRNLITAGHLPAGDVDERPIQEVQPDDVRGYSQAHFFAGIGGWAYALQLAEWGDRPVWTGSCPCQPFSAAGKRASSRDDRHLWPGWLRLLRKCHPLTVFGEQVSSSVGLGWLDAVALDLEAEGYAVGASVLGAHSVGAPHFRQRLYFVANTPSVSRNVVPFDSIRSGQSANETWQSGRQDFGILPLGSRWEDHQPTLCCEDDGVPNYVEQLRAYGNAIVPQVAAAFVSAYLECGAVSAPTEGEPK